MTDQDKHETIDWCAELMPNVGWVSRVIHARVQDQHAVADVIRELGTATATWPASTSDLVA